MITSSNKLYVPRLCYATDWEKKDKSLVFNTLFFLWYGIFFFHFDEKKPCVKQDLTIKLRSL